VSGTRITRELVSADDVARLLVKHGIRHAILNACNSAKEFGVRSNIAKALIKEGLDTVVAMSFKAIASSVEQFIAVYYSMLLLGESTMVEATYAARKALQQHRMKDTRYAVKVEVADSIVPVIYRSASPTQPVDISQITLPYIEGLCPPLPFDVDRVDGRENDVFLLETFLLLQSNVGLIVGPAAVGKTALLKHLCWWWKNTGFIEESLVYDMFLPESGRVVLLQTEVVCKVLHLNFLGELGEESDDIEERVIEFFRKHRCLLVFDSFDAAYVSAPRDRQNFITRFLRKLVGGQSFVLIASRRSEKMGSLHCFTHVLSGIGLIPALQFSRDLLEVYSHPILDGDSESAAYLERILKLADGNPLAIQLLLHDLSRHKQWTTKDYFDSISAGNPVHIDPVWISQPCDNGARSIIELQSLLADYSIEHLGLFWHLLPIDALPVYLLLLSWEMQYHLEARWHFRNSSLLVAAGHGTLTPELVSQARDSISEALDILLKAGFLQKLKLRTRQHLTQLGYAKVHPLLPIVSRSNERYQRTDYMAYCKSGFVMFYGYLSRDWPWERPATDPLWKTPRCVIEDDFVNILSAVNIQLSAPFRGASVRWSPNRLLSAPEKGTLRDISRLEVLLDVWDRTVDRYWEKLKADTEGTDRPSYCKEIFGLKNPTAKLGESSSSEDETDISSEIAALQQTVDLLCQAQLVKYADILWRHHAHLASGNEKKYEKIIGWVKAHRIDVGTDQREEDIKLQSDIDDILEAERGLSRVEYGKFLAEFWSQRATNEQDNDFLPELFERFRITHPPHQQSRVSYFFANIVENTNVARNIQGLLHEHKFLEARHQLEAALDREINQRGNNPGSKIMLHFGLVDVANLLNDWQAALQHLNHVFSIRSSMPERPILDLPIEKYAMLVNQALAGGDTRTAIGCTRVILEYANKCHAEPAVTVQALLALEKAMSMCSIIINLPISRTFLSVRAIMSSYYDQGLHFSALSDGPSLEQLIQTAKEEQSRMNKAETIEQQTISEMLRLLNDRIQGALDSYRDTHGDVSRKALDDLRAILFSPSIPQSTSDVLGNWAADVSFPFSPLGFIWRPVTDPPSQ